MPRAPPGLSLLLMAALAFAATPPFQPDEKDDKLKIINPWISACDLMQPASATDLKGACPDMWGPGPFCPCPPSNNSTTQCLLNYLKESHKEEVCRKGVKPKDRRSTLSTLRMRHCCEHAVDSALPAEALENDATCYRMLDALLAVDALAARISCEFAEVLYRYDCGQKYSIKHQCEDCKEVYRKWVCSSMVPHYFNRSARVRPCPSVCQSVEQKCPYMLPGDRAPAHPTQYAGEPTFLCLDPNIPETGDQRLKSSVGDEDCCYNYSYCDTPDQHGSGSALCVTCPAGPANITVSPVNCSAGLVNSTSSCIAGSSSANSSVGGGSGSSSSSSSSDGSSSYSVGVSSGASKTLSTNRRLKQVLPLWTAWIILIQILPQQIISLTSITNTVNNLIVRHLLVNMLCATCVRTSLLLTRIKTKWRKPWS